MPWKLLQIFIASIQKNQTLAHVLRLVGLVVKGGDDVIGINANNISGSKGTQTYNLYNQDLNRNHYSTFYFTIDIALMAYLYNIMCVHIVTHEIRYLSQSRTPENLPRGFHV